jgi:hypothetical protein
MDGCRCDDSTVPLRFPTAGDVGEQMERRRILRDAQTLGLAVLLGGSLYSPTNALADESGVSFWLPGLLGSFTAVPLQPGWSVTAMEYYDSVRAGGDVALAKEYQIGHLTTTLRADINGSLISRENLGVLIPSYTFEQRFLGAQATIQVLTIFGRTRTTEQGAITGTLGPFGFSTFSSQTDSAVETSDLYPTLNLRWNEGVNNFMTYVAADLPIGQYDENSLSNLGIGHYAIDGGIGYTYFDQQAGLEFSALAGLTYNYINPYTNYQNGLDFHVDWGASLFLTKQLLIGTVGYLYDQVTGDSGSGDHVGPFMSRVVGVGPQIGIFFRSGTIRHI